MDKQKVLNSIIIFLCVVLVSFILIGVLNSKKDYIKVTDHIYIEEGLNRESADTIQQYIDILPQCIKQYFIDEGDWKVCVVNSLPNMIKGQTVIEEKCVYIVSGYEYDLLLHEFAHIYLHKNPFDGDFEEIYKQEAKAMIEAYYGMDSEYHYSNSTEFYCTAWNIVYMMQGNDQFGVAPKTFDYFSTLFNELY